MEQLIKKLNDLKIQQTGDWEEDIPEEIYNEYFSNFQVVETELNVDTRRWYELSTEVFKLNGEFIGVNIISNVFSENMDYSDVGHTLEFFEMEEIPSITYKKKK